MNNNITIKPLLPADVKTLLQFASTEGWSPGVYDMALYHKIDPQGLTGIYLDDELIGTSAVFRYNPWFAFFGMYIVRPEYREQGFGIEMTRYRLHLAGYRNIGLDGVPEKVDTYRRVGFRDAHLNQRFSISAASAAGVEEPEGLVDLKSLPLSAILAFERNHRLFPGPRKTFLQHWLRFKKFIGRAVITDGELQGYMLLRPCADGMRVGPFLATSTETARTLLHSILHHSKGQKVLIDSPVTNPDASALLSEFNGKVVFETIRMYRGYQPDLQHCAIYGLTALEAG